MMFDRLIDSLEISPGVQRQQLIARLVPLASAVLLYSVVPADRRFRAVEGTALAERLQLLFAIDTEKARRLIARAVSAMNAERSVFSSATVLKRSSDYQFRLHLLAGMESIARSDFEFHRDEACHIERARLLLGAYPSQSSTYFSAL